MKTLLSSSHAKTRGLRRYAFTLVELLVVIAIIGVLIALLLPAVQAAREAARRMQCTNHMKQIGLGIHNFHDTQNGIPPYGLGTNSSTNGRRASFWAFILPYIEQQALYDFLCQANSGIGRTFPTNGTNWNNGTEVAGHQGLHSDFDNTWFSGLSATEQSSVGSIPIVKCPTRRSGVSNLTNGSTSDDGGNNANRNGPTGDYAVVIALNVDAAAGAEAPHWWNQLGDVNNSPSRVVGPFRIAAFSTMYDYKSWKPRDTMSWWQDGTSNQLVIGEKHVPLGGVNYSTPSRSGDMSLLSFCNGWAAAGPFRPIAAGKTTGTQNYRVGLLRSGKDFSNMNSDYVFRPISGDPNYTAETKNTVAFGAWHSGITNFVIGDGSVRSVSNTIDTVTLGWLGITNDGNSVSFYCFVPDETRRFTTPFIRTVS